MLPLWSISDPANITDDVDIAAFPFTCHDWLFNGKLKVWIDEVSDGHVIPEAIIKVINIFSNGSVFFFSKKRREKTESKREREEEEKNKKIYQIHKTDQDIQWDSYIVLHL